MRSALNGYRVRDGKIIHPLDVDFLEDGEPKTKVERLRSSEVPKNFVRNYDRDVQKEADFDDESNEAFDSLLT